MRGLLAAEQRLHAARIGVQQAVDEARGAGFTWQQVGEVLGMSRQAAFKRFGRPEFETRTMTLGTGGDVLADTEAVFDLLAQAEWQTLREWMTPAAARELTEDRLRDTWVAALQESGNLIECRRTRVELPDGTPISADEELLGIRVGVTELHCEAGEWVGRVAWTPERQVAGLLVVPPGSGPWQF